MSDDNNVLTFADRGIEPDPEPDKPRRGRPKGSKNTGTSRGRKPSVQPIKDGLTTIFGGIGTVLYAFPATQRDAVVIAQNSEPLVNALGELAQQDRRVREVLNKMVMGSAWGSVVMASAGIALPILANHNLLPSHLNFLFATDEQGSSMADVMMEGMDANPDAVPTVSEEGPSVA